MFKSRNETIFLIRLRVRPSEDDVMATTDKVMTDNPVVVRIIELVKSRGKKEIDLAEYLHIPTGSMAKWKYYGGTSYLRYVDRICEFLDTTPNYLFWGVEETEDQLSFSEKEMIRMYRNLEDGKKNCLRDIMKYFSKTTKES